MPRKKKQEIATIGEVSSNQPATEQVNLMSPDMLKMQVATETLNRKIIKEFITNHMVEKIDYGKIHVFKSCPNHKTPWLCKNEYHFSKNTLFKPGAEKFASLFKMRAGYKRDLETWEMLGSPAGTICYVCNLFTTKDVLLGEGRGAASVAEKGNPNTAIKIAKKRAFVDAVLSTGALSDFFTQDLEDMKDLEPETDDVQSVPTVFTPAPSKTPVKKEVSLKSKIIILCRLLHIETNDPFLDDVIKKITKLDVNDPGNHAEIVSRLEFAVKQNQESKK